MEFTSIAERILSNRNLLRQNSKLLFEGNYHTVYELVDYPSVVLKIRSVSFMHGGRPNKQQAKQEVEKENEYQELLKEYLPNQIVLKQKSFVIQEEKKSLIATIQEKYKQFLTSDFSALSSTYLEFGVKNFSFSEYLNFHKALFESHTKPDFASFLKFNSGSFQLIEELQSTPSLKAELRLFFEGIVLFLKVSDQIPDFGGRNVIVNSTENCKYNIKVASTYKNERYNYFLECLDLVQTQDQMPSDIGRLSSLLNGLTFARLVQVFLILTGSKIRLDLTFDDKFFQHMYEYSFSERFS